MADTLKERKIYRILTDVGTRAWDKIAFWTTAKSVDAADGRNLQTKVGAINGITSDINGESDNIAASIKCVKQLNNKFGGMRFGVDGDGNYGYYGADGSLIPFKRIDLVSGTVSKKITSGSTYTLTFNTGKTGYSNYALQPSLHAISTNTVKDAYYGIGINISYNKSTGVITYTLNDPKQVTSGFSINSTVTVKYVLWNEL